MFARALFVATLRQMLSIGRLVRFGLLALAPAAIYILSRPGSARERFDSFLGIGLGTFYVVAVPVITLIVAATALGDERRDGTLSFILLRPISRFRIAGAKIAAASLAAFVLTGFGALGLSLAFGVTAADTRFVVPMLVGTAIATVLYAAIFVPLGYLADRSTLIGLAFVFIWENGIAGALPALGVTSPWRLGYSAFVGLSPAEVLPRFDSFALANLQPGAGGALLRAAVIAAISVTVTAWMLRSRDTTA